MNGEGQFGEEYRRIEDFEVAQVNFGCQLAKEAKSRSVSNCSAKTDAVSASGRVGCCVKIE